MLETVAVTAELGDIFSSRDVSYDRVCAWRYFATNNGVFRVYPGVKLTKEFDATKTRWYMLRFG